MKQLCFILFCLIGSNCTAQISDMDLIFNYLGTDTKQTRQIKFGIAESKLTPYNPLYLALDGLMFTYQKYISQQTNSNCPYSPSCSEYGKLLIKRYGIIKGIPCAADRLLRCNPSTVSLLKWKIDAKDRHIHETVEYYQIRK